MKVLALQWETGKMVLYKQKSFVDRTEFHLMMEINVPPIPVIQMHHVKTFFRISSVHAMMDLKAMASVAFQSSKWMSVSLVSTIAMPMQLVQIWEFICL